MNQDRPDRGKIQDILVGFKYGNLNSVPLVNRAAGLKEADQILALMDKVVAEIFEEIEKQGFEEISEEHTTGWDWWQALKSKHQASQ